MSRAKDNSPVRKKQTQIAKQIKTKQYSKWQDGDGAYEDGGANPKPGFADRTSRSNPESGAHRKASASKGYHSSPDAGPRKKNR